MDGSGKIPHTEGTMPDTIMLSEAAVALFRRRVAGERIEVTSETRPLYRELAAAGLMYPVSGFTHGPEANFRLTEEGWARRGEFSVAVVPPAGST
jgi:hypothetical protein